MASRVGSFSQPSSDGSGENESKMDGFHYDVSSFSWKIIFALFVCRCRFVHGAMEGLCGAFSGRAEAWREGILFSTGTYGTSK